MSLRNWLAVILISVAPATVLTTESAAQSQPAPQNNAAQPTPAPSGPTAGESKDFANIKVLKDIPEDQLIPSMQFINAALGVECNFCHVTDRGHEGFALDEKRPKATAREMMTMTHDINANNFKGQQRVTCATCHAGHSNPTPSAPVLTEVSWQERVDARARTQGNGPGAQPQKSAAAGGNGAPQPEGRPSPEAMQAAADEILTKYTQAIGGEDAINKLTSRSEKGTIATPHGDSMSYELQQKAPDKVVMLRTIPGGTQARIVYNGTDAVFVTKQGKNPIHGFDLNALKLDANFFRNLKLKQQYASVRALQFAPKIDDHETKAIRGALSNQMGQETLYFDAQSGLLLRRLTVLRTALGGVAQQYDYSDYHEINGVKVPFTAKISTAENIQTRKIAEEKFNVAIADSEFEPSSASAPGSN